MSSLTQCNRCTLDRMERQAAKRGATVILGRTEDGWVSAKYSDRKDPSAFFLELTEKCAC